ncbi:hypothetical protein DMH25_08340 [Streptomyces sp. WAC 01325]|uniref:hypothetical protein n=1 Tax=Streptomyces sp. WAC 01325 TaxID=2203202 RepID=UPI000F87B628|nr:hypothetical protein [Streptomyces sp. WAC 01325]RSN13786.1 hypothetical protein DMH25_08340 [Streptomyces sp. WAC 01325]
MSYFNAAFFLDKSFSVNSSGTPNAALHITPDANEGGYVTFQIEDKLPIDDQVKVAETLLKGVQRWRDQLVESAQRQRTTEDELAAAREEIARLKAERDGGAS